MAFLSFYIDAVCLYSGIDGMICRWNISRLLLVSYLSWHGYVTLIKLGAYWLTVSEHFLDFSWPLARAISTIARFWSGIWYRDFSWASIIALAGWRRNNFCEIFYWGGILIMPEIIYAVNASCSIAKMVAIPADAKYQTSFCAFKGRAALTGARLSRHYQNSFRIYLKRSFTR